MTKISRIGCWIAITLLSMALFWSVLINIGMVFALFSGPGEAANDHPVDQKPSFEEVWSYGQGKAKVVRIGLSGVIMHGGEQRLFGSGPDMVESILTQILAAKNDPDVRAILLEVNSPGGAVTPSDEIYTALQQFKQSRKGRKVVVFIRGLGASGAYYASMAGDYIMAEPTAIVGSVGVIMQTVNIKELGDKIGLKAVTIASGKNKDMLNPLEAVNPQHVAMMQGLVNSMQDRFASIVMASRGLSSRKLLDGRVFTAQKALNDHFIDGIGYWLEAVNQLKTMLGVKDLYIVRYVKKQGFFESLFEAKSPRIPSFSSMEAPRFLYQWKP